MRYFRVATTVVGCCCGESAANPCARGACRAGYRNHIRARQVFKSSQLRSRHGRQRTAELISIAAGRYRPRRQRLHTQLRSRSLGGRLSATAILGQPLDTNLKHSRSNRSTWRHIGDRSCQVRHVDVDDKWCLQWRCIWRWYGSLARNNMYTSSFQVQYCARGV